MVGPSAFPVGRHRRSRRVRRKPRRIALWLGSSARHESSAGPRGENGSHHIVKTWCSGSIWPRYGVCRSRQHLKRNVGESLPQACPRTHDNPLPCLGSRKLLLDRHLRFGVASRGCDGTLRGRTAAKLPQQTSTTIGESRGEGASGSLA